MIAFSGSFSRAAIRTIDGKAEREVRLRLMGVLFSDEIPDPRDVVLLCLADACGILKGHPLAT